MNLSKLARISSNAGCLTPSQYLKDFFQNLLWISLVVLKKLLQFIRPIENSTYRIHDPTGIKFVNRLRAGFSDLQEHKLRYNFVDTLNPLCTCVLETECTGHFFLHCHNYTSLRTILMKESRDINSSLASCSCNDILGVILCGDKRFNPCMKKRILPATIKYIKNMQKSFLLFFSIFLSACLIFVDMNVIFFSLKLFYKQPVYKPLALGR